MKNRVDEFNHGHQSQLSLFFLLQNGDLYDYIINTQEADEGRARCVINDIANAVHYLHGMKIVHRDIKPENFLIFPLPNGEHVVKLCDFGLAVDARQTITEVCGSPSYVAPEVLRMENYGLPVDIWSCGVVFYILLCHFPPFYAENTRKLFQKIMKGNFDFPSPYWDDVSESAKDLISRMLVLNTDRRLQAEEMISHPWLQEVNMAFNSRRSYASHCRFINKMAGLLWCLKKTVRVMFGWRLCKEGKGCLKLLLV